MTRLQEQLRSFDFPPWPKGGAIDLGAIFDRQNATPNADVEDLLRIIGALVNGGTS